MPIDPVSFSEIVAIYQTEIDSLIENMGKNVTLYYPREIISEGKSFNDPVYGDTRMPDYKQTVSNPAPDDQPVTDIMKVLIKYNPAEFATFGNKAEFPKGVIRIKTYMYNLPKLKRCEYLIANSDSQGIFYGKYRLIREPIPVGLQKDRYCISYWSRM